MVISTRSSTKNTAATDSSSNASNSTNIDSHPKSNNNIKADRRFLLVFCIIGIYVSFITWGIIQEKITSEKYNSIHVAYPPSKFNYIKLLNFIQCVCAGVAGLLFCIYKGLPATLKPYNKVFMISFTNTVGSPFSYIALNFVSFPIVTLVKSCKLVPVMIMSGLVGKKKFSYLEYICCILISLGVVMFTSLKKNMSIETENFNLLIVGVLLVLLNLAFDGMTNALQDSMFETENVTPAQMMYSMNIVGGVLLFVAMCSPFDFNQLPFFTGVPWNEVEWMNLWHGFENSELANSITFVINHPTCLRDVFLFGICGAVGQIFIFICMAEFGAVILTVITITRKFFSILFSMLWFEHQFNVYQLLGCLLVFGGLGIESYLSSLKPHKKKHVLQTPKEEHIKAN